MNRLDELHALLSENVAKATELLKREDEAAKGKCKDKEDGCKNKTVWIFAVLGIVAVVAAAIYGLYRFFAPDYLEDFEDDFDDDFDDDFFEDEAEESEKEGSEAEESEKKDLDEESDEKDEAEDASDEAEDTITEDMTEEE